MPYVDQDIKRENRALKRHVRSRELYHIMGLERISNRVRCTYCGKDTSESCSHRFRHTDDCPMISVTAAILNVPVELMNATVNPQLRLGYCQLQLKF